MAESFNRVTLMVGDMTNSGLSLVAQDCAPCRYDGSRLLFRGPRRALEGEYVAFLGGTETFGKFVPQPFPDLVEEITGVTCVNFGLPNAGIDVYAHDAALIDCAGRARLAVLQVPCALNMSNMYYRVHPRRNDRFLQASDALRALYEDVDFTEFSFTRHMLKRLRHLSPERFAYVRQELSRVWVDGMRDVIDRIAAPTILLWLSARRPEAACDDPDVAADPALVSLSMLEELRPSAAAITKVIITSHAGLARSSDQKRQRTGVPGPEAHSDVAEALVPVVADCLEQ